MASVTSCASSERVRRDTHRAAKPCNQGRSAAVPQLKGDRFERLTAFKKRYGLDHAQALSPFPFQYLAGNAASAFFRWCLPLAPVRPRTSCRLGLAGGIQARSQASGRRTTEGSPLCGEQAPTRLPRRERAFSSATHTPEALHLR